MFAVIIIIIIIAIIIQSPTTPEEKLYERKDLVSSGFCLLLCPYHGAWHAVAGNRQLLNE